MASKKEKRIRFTEDTTNGHTEGMSPAKRRKRPRPERPNEDEIDDVDDWGPQDDEDNVDIPREKDLIEAKRERRWQQKHLCEMADDNEDTEIDNRTSLAAEGIEVEPFSMDQERSDGTGYFDGDTYVFRKRDEDEEPDAWLESLSDKKEDFAGVSRFRGKQKDDDTSMDILSDTELYARILPLVSDTETVSKALIRYGDLMKRPATKGGSTDAVKMAETCLNELTGAANALLLQGVVDIYQKTRNDIAAALPKATASANSTQSTRVGKEKIKAMWEYKGLQDGEMHGPYTTEQMQGWLQLGYFVGPSAVKVRSIIEKEKEVSMQDDLLADLMDDTNVEGPEKTATDQVFGEWVMSDKVDFSCYA